MGLAGTAPDRYPLLLNLHPLVIYRHQVIKQADVVLATVMLPERFSPEERRRIFAYDDPLTTGDSSLSAGIQATAAADAGDDRSAEEYLIDAAAVDMADTAGNLRDGVHVSSAAGTWMAVVTASPGIAGGPTCPSSPDAAEQGPPAALPAAAEGFAARGGGEIEEEVVTYRVRSGARSPRADDGRRFTVSTDAPVSFPGRYRTRDAAASG